MKDEAKTVRGIWKKLFSCRETIIPGREKMKVEGKPMKVDQQTMMVDQQTATASMVF